MKIFILENKLHLIRIEIDTEKVVPVKATVLNKHHNKILLTLEDFTLLRAEAFISQYVSYTVKTKEIYYDKI